MTDDLANAIELSDGGHYAKAIANLERIVRKDSRNQRALFECGYAYLCQENADAAIEKLR